MFPKKGNLIGKGNCSDRPCLLEGMQGKFPERVVMKGRLENFLEIQSNFLSYYSEKNQKMLGLETWLTFGKLGSGLEMSEKMTLLVSENCWPGTWEMCLH